LAIIWNAFPSAEFDDFIDFEWHANVIDVVGFKFSGQFLNVTD
jgi:hypothetical protein